MAHALIIALLALFAHSPHHDCIALHEPDIARRLESAESVHGVPPGVLLVVAALESHLGCASGSGGCWGAPIDPRHRGTAGTSDHAARALARGFAVCHTWAGAIRRFRSGLCFREPPVGYTTRTALRMIERVYDDARLPRPEHLR